MAQALFIVVLAAVVYFARRHAWQVCVCLQSRRVLNAQVRVQGISKNLVSRAFPSGPERPDYLTSQEFLKFTPTEDFMSLPGEIFRTEFRLVVTHEGWEHTVLERELGAHVDPLRKMLVTVSRCLAHSLQPAWWACMLTGVPVLQGLVTRVIGGDLQSADAQIRTAAVG